jgi:hypothetical protein
MGDVHPLTMRKRVGCGPPLDELLLDAVPVLDELLLEPAPPPPLVEVLLELPVLLDAPPVPALPFDPQAITPMMRGRRASTRLLMILFSSLAVQPS